MKINCGRLYSTVGSMSDSSFKGPKFDFQLCHITFMESDLEIVSIVILSHLLIQDRQLSVAGKSMHTKY